MLGPLLKVQMWFCVAGAKDSAPCQKWEKREGFEAVSTTTTPLQYNYHYHYNYNYTTLHYTTLITLHSTKLHYIQLRHITLH